MRNKKRIRSMFVLFTTGLLIFSLSACYALSEDVDIEEEVKVEEVETIEEIEEIGLHIEENNNLSINAHILEDIDFLIYHMNESFPFFGVSERRLGKDLKDGLNFVRQSVEETKTQLNTRRFHSILEGNIYRFQGLAHLGVFHPDSRSELTGRFTVGHNLSRPPMTQPLSITRSENRAMTFRSLEEDRIAYINIFTLRNSLTSTENRLLQEFLLEVQDYEHLIIDIRETTGGYLQGFARSLIAPNLPDGESIFYHSFAFYTDGELAGKVAENHRKSGFNMHLSSFPESEILPAKELVEKYNLHQMNEDDLANLAYGYKIQTFLSRANGLVPFNGKIWVLTSHQNYSASEAFARLSKEAGFTLVGTTTGGSIGGGGSVYFRLPNTNIAIILDALYITDDTGRALEEFPTEPHYHISRGEDALQVTLDLIESGQY